MDEALKWVDASRSDIVDACVNWGNLSDVAGGEIAVAEAVAEAYGAAGLQVRLQSLGEASANVVGWMPAGGGPTLILNSHIDTEGAVPRGPAERRRLRGTWQDGELLIGKGLVNAKVHVVAQLFALRALLEGGWAPGGEVILTAVGQETGSAVTDPRFEWNGPHMGEGTGSRHLVDHGVVGDYALVGEPNGFAIGAAQAGYVRLRIAIEGFVPYTPFIERDPARSPNPFERAAPVVAALEQWARSYESRSRAPFGDSFIAPKAQVHDVRSGEPPFTERSDRCLVFFDVRTHPEARPMEIVRDVRKVVADVDAQAQVQVYEFRRGQIAQGAGRLVEAVTRAHAAVFGQPPSSPHPSQISMWQDTNVFNAAGIPSVAYGVRPVPEGHTREGIRAVLIPDILSLTKVYALTIADIAKDDR